jgi:tetratricopeptide (TPR) repeat protein
MTHFAAGQMLEHQSDLQGAIEQYEKAIAMNPRFTTAYNRLGIVYQKLARYEDAEHIFKEGILADAGAAILRNNLGYTYLLQNRLPEAEAQFRDALQIAPDFKRARMNLAISLARAGRTEDSLIEFSRVVPADVAHFDVGVIRLDLKDYAAAESAFREALSLNPSCPRAKVYLEHTLRLAGGERANPPSPPGQISRNESLAGQIGDEAIGPPAP